MIMMRGMPDVMEPSSSVQGLPEVSLCVCVCIEKK